MFISNQELKSSSDLNKIKINLNENLTKDLSNKLSNEISFNINERNLIKNNVIPTISGSLENHGFISKFHKKFFGSSVRKRKKIFYTVLSIFVILVLICSIILFLIFGIIPCLLTKCHPKANTCINHAFYAECVCDDGFNGNGREYCDECGISINRQNVRIVGGSEAVPYSWPSASLIIANYKTDYIIKNGYSVTIDISFLCGGTLINRKTVLTAAHCIIDEFDYEHRGESYSIKIQPNKYYPTIESMYRVFLGVHNRSVLFSKNISPAITVPVEKIHMHEKYDDENVLNDITIFKLKKIVDLNEFIQVACLPNPKWTKNFPIPNSQAFILGWGTTSEEGSIPHTLRNVKITVYDGSMCNKVITQNKKTWDSLICAGDINGGKDTCQGDSGGPLFIRDNVNNKPKFICAGIVSYGDGCGKVNKPGLYTRTIYYLDWIAEKSKF